MTYDVWLTRKENKFIACVRQWPAIIVEGDSEQEVLRKAQADLQSLLAKGRIIQLEIETEPEAHPWQRFAGMFVDDPDWDTFQESIQAYREELDRGLPEV
jgi:predicted RNase H-like HicB family nuclease